MLLAPLGRRGTQDSRSTWTSHVWVCSLVQVAGEEAQSEIYTTLRFYLWWATLSPVGSRRLGWSGVICNLQATAQKGSWAAFDHVPSCECRCRHRHGL